MFKFVAVLACLALASATTKTLNVDNISYKHWLRAGDMYTEAGLPLNNLGLAFGQAIDENMKGVFSLDTTTSYAVAADSDFTSIIKPKGGNRIFSISSFEWTVPSSLYISELVQDNRTGVLTAISSKPIDVSKLGGIMAPCAGSQSPWGTHLHGEEVDPDGKVYETATQWSELPGDLSSGAGYEFAKYFGMYNITAPKTLSNGIKAVPLNFTAFKNKYQPYKYGHVLEVAVSATGVATPRKLMTFGRMSFELATCLPDGKVCYMTDDTYNGVFTKAVLTTANNPNHTTLYAAKFTTVNATGGGKFNVEWIKLGSASNDYLQSVLDRPVGLKFSDMFDVMPINASKKCNDPTYRAVYTASDGFECLRIKYTINRNVIAYFETRRYAAYLGATTEQSRYEGLDYDLVTNSLYFAMTGVDQGALANSAYDVPGVDHMKLTTANTCGCIYQAKMDATRNVKTVEAILCGKPISTDSNGNKCDLTSIASPDNVIFMRNTSTLIIYEDTSRHQNNMAWAMDVKIGASSLTRIGSSMFGSEWTSANYVQNLNGWNYLVGVVQHPYDSTEGAKRILEPASTGKACYVGYMGPFPTAAMKGTLRWRPVPLPQNSAKHLIVTSSRVAVDY